MSNNFIILRKNSLLTGKAKFTIHISLTINFKSCKFVKQQNKTIQLICQKQFRKYHLQ